MQLGKTKVFLREDVVKQLETAREAIWDEGAGTVQRAGRRRQARRVGALLKTNAAGAAKVKAALDAKNPAEAAAALDALKAAWAASKVPSALSPSVQRGARALGELEIEVQQMEEAKVAEDAALTMR